MQLLVQIQHASFFVMTDADIEAALSEVRAWLEHPEAGGYRMLKLRLLLDKGYVDLQETMLLWEDRHKG